MSPIEEGQSWQKSRQFMLCHWSHGPMTDMTGRQVGTWKATPLYLDIICKIDTPPTLCTVDCKMWLTVTMQCSNIIVCTKCT